MVNPDDIVKEYGADTMRLYEMFIGDFEKAAPWSSSSIKGCKRFLERIWALQDCLVEGDSYRPEVESAMHKTIKKVSEDIENLKFNTAIAAMMSLLNDISDTGAINRAEYRDLLIMLNPFAPHMTEEIWQLQNMGGMLNATQWVSYDEAKCKDSTIEIAVQVCGKIRARITIPADTDKDTVLSLAKENATVHSFIDGKQIVKEIYVPGKLVNIVAK